MEVISLNQDLTIQKTKLFHCTCNVEWIYKKEYLNKTEKKE